MERRAPGLEAFFHGVSEDGSHAVLDLGPSVEENFRLYSRFARQIRFAGMTSDPPRGVALENALQALGPPRNRGFDLVLAWNILDLLSSEEHPLILKKLVELTDEGARLYAVVDTSSEGRSRPTRFEILDRDRIRQEPLGRPRAIPSPLLPADVERLLGPFQVFHAFTLRMGLREYIGVKGGGV